MPPLEITPEDEKNIESGNWKAVAAKWLFAQGVPVVLLFILVIGLGYGVVVLVPWQIKTFQDGYERLDAKHTEAVERMNAQHERVNASHDRALERVSDALDRLREKP